VTGRRRRHLSRDDIDREAERVALHFDPSAFHRTTSPVYEVVRGFQDDYSVPFSFGQDLGFSQSGRKVVGRFYFGSRRIAIDGILPLDSPRFRWTLSHEIGHLVLHRKIDPRTITGGAPELVDTRVQLRFGRAAQRSGLDWVEWQANKFAAALLLPRPILFNALSSVQKELDVRRPGSIYLDDQRHNIAAYVTTLQKLVALLAVSRTMLRIRLIDLGLLVDARPFHQNAVQEALRSLLPKQ
jgi:Zn-dependent peptidase ImmA (M78 family)